MVKGSLLNRNINALNCRCLAQKLTSWGLLNIRSIHADSNRGVVNSSNLIIIPPYKPKSKSVLRSPYLTSHYVDALAFKLVEDPTVHNTLEDVFQDIESYKPKSVNTSAKSFRQLVNTLEVAFRKEQLRKFAKVFHIKSSSLRKKEIIERILLDHWKLRIHGDAMDDMLAIKDVTLCPLEMFFLLLNNASALRDISQKHAAHVVINVTNNNIKIEAKKRDVAIVEELISGIFKHLKSKTIDVTEYYANIINKNAVLLSERCKAYIELSGKAQIKITTAFGNCSFDEIERKLLSFVMLFENTDKCLIDSECLTSKKSFTLNDFTYDFRLPWYLKDDSWKRWCRVKEYSWNTSVLSDEALTRNSLTLPVPIKPSINKDISSIEVKDLSQKNTTQSKKLNSYIRDSFHSVNDFWFSSHATNTEQCFTKRLTATFGYSLFSSSFLSHTKNPDVASFYVKERSKAHHFLFNTFVDQIPSYLKNHSILDETTRKSFYRIILSSNSLSTSLTYPLIEIILPIKNGFLMGKETFQIAFKKSRGYQILLPESELDLKINTTTFKTIANNKSVDAFLDDCVSFFSRPEMTQDSQLNASSGFLTNFSLKDSTDRFYKVLSYEKVSERFVKIDDSYITYSDIFSPLSHSHKDWFRIHTEENSSKNFYEIISEIVGGFPYYSQANERSLIS
ncbi:Protein sls1 [Schizosaccharomyces pombe]|uniref:Mitochondrial translation factor sls1 n=1 Tax=Schizosaccharomyces pombe (strain 972 / ATCC 24843) TaxID=284812 RepID=SLS1_SCHPO|nr:uncharacterized protein SPAP8A3.14c [Schizosaccharomyces pombe]Q9UT03.1 RecName: Full=Protein sls1; Flags: Precursor [Schizosaccharomyces pombe 972h-]CAB55181.1 mitochondrial inner membrane protein (predicted) [Schizosaccharomyces pombe]|eukprot:NP_594953.1 uncharacterized protein SPAP8A3.14c [Schizosaccharomyces pombe]